MHVFVQHRVHSRIIPAIILWLIRNGISFYKHDKVVGIDHSFHFEMTISQARIEKKNPWCSSINILRSKQNGLNFADNILICNKNSFVVTHISRRFVPRHPINDDGSLLHEIASRRTDKHVSITWTKTVSYFDSNFFKVCSYSSN